jgi:hypothetical protein
LAPQNVIEGRWGVGGDVELRVAGDRLDDWFDGVGRRGRHGAAAETHSGAKHNCRGATEQTHGVVFS